MREEEQALDKVWKAVTEVYDAKEGEKVHVDLTSGYFGLYKAYKKAIIDSPAPVRVIAASPKVREPFRSWKPR
jgi:CDP-diacylglycerol--glycerol-3-phosphate 3-phosphatidyltransferase